MEWSKPKARNNIDNEFFPIYRCKGLLIYICLQEVQEINLHDDNCKWIVANRQKVDANAVNDSMQIDSWAYRSHFQSLTLEWKSSQWPYYLKYFITITKN